MYYDDDYYYYYSGLDRNGVECHRRLASGSTDFCIFTQHGEFELAEGAAILRPVVETAALHYCTMSPRDPTDAC